MPENRIADNQLTKANRLVDARLKSLRGERPFMLQFIGKIGEVDVINDSAATTLEKTGESLMAFEKPVVWIVDSRAYLQDFRILAELIRSKVKTIVATGDFADEVHRAVWGEIGYFVSAHSWEEALDMATLVSKAEDTILFSPGCRAGEPFENYSERGEYFNRLVDIKSQ